MDIDRKIEVMRERLWIEDVPVIMISAEKDSANIERAYDLGVTAMFSINREPRPLAESGPRSGENYRRTLEDIMRLIRAVEGR